MLGLEYQSKRGYIGLEYCRRMVGIKIMPVVVHMGQIESVLSLADKEWRVEELQQQFEGETVLLGVDDMDIFKGINMKLLAMEHMLSQYPNWQGRAVLVQIANPARGRGRGLHAIQTEIQASCERINEQFEQPGYEPIGVSGSESSSDSNLPKKSMLVVSAFIGCSPSLSGAIRINPWNVESEALNDAISMAEVKKQLRHEKHYRYVSTHDVAYWSRSFM
ncbi:hypothetical protein IFM89_023231 [Coptis chinensis]|uniref:Trehalose-6-phosphate synthase n=1 Tax=Coptis chinensis TaxID=261450 RepID=A0A835IX76_9MAGN|nr:hypothetical protein IFM89_023231 [Coptis chinensis]